MDTTKHTPPTRYGSWWTNNAGLVLSLHFRSGALDDEPGVLETVQYLDESIQREVDTGITSSRIVLMGFSQGAGMTLLTALTGGDTRGQSKDDGWKLAGIVPLSGRMPLTSKFKSLASSYASEIPIFWAHGEEDTMVQYQYGCACAGMPVAEGFARKLGREELGLPGLCFVTYRLRPGSLWLAL